MCLGIPMKIKRIEDKFAFVESGGIQRRVNIEMIRCKPGDYVLVHAGFAIQKVDPQEAKKTLEFVKEINIKG